MAAGSGNKPRILIFGTGSGGVNFYKSYRQRYQVLGFLDNSQQKHGQRLFGKTIHAPQSINMLSFDKIIIASDYYREINQQLLNELAVDEQRIGFSHSEEPLPQSRFKLWCQQMRRLSHKRLCEKPGLVSSVFHGLFSRETGKGAKPVLKRLPLRWLDTMHDNKVHVFRQSRPDKVQGPRVFGDQVPPIDIQLPEVALYHFKHARACSVSRSVVLPGEQLIVERVLTATMDNADYGNGHVLHHNDSHGLIIQHPQVRLEKGILINGLTETNYYHWILEILSQLEFIAELPRQYADYPVLISAFSQKIPSITSYLATFNIDRPLVFLEAQIAYEVDDLLFINAPNNLIANLKNAAGNLTEDGFIRRESLDYLRSHALPLANTIDASTLPKRVFLARKHNLRTYNQADIFAVLDPLGFTAVYMEELDFSRQVALMANAEVVVGPTGAAWTNILFASQGTRALCWMAEEYGDLSCFSNLADKVGVDLDYIHYAAGTKDSRQLYSKEYSLDKNLVSRWARDKLPALA
ncbi:glycosyltransferase family 61 protein [Pseudomonas sp. Pseusp122]|uniref:glycosyltransferase family 61 protein n=1 Tax=unclassified Pseudomonas TaxID=196821 RepID=UPI0039A6E742